MGIGTILMLIVNLVPSILQETGVISPGIESLISKLGGALPGLITSLAAGKGPTDEVMAILDALQTEIGVLMKSTTLSPNGLALASSLDGALTDALAGYKAAQVTTDPSTLTPLPETLPVT